MALGEEERNRQALRRYCNGYSKLKNGNDKKPIATSIMRILLFRIMPALAAAIGTLPEMIPQAPCPIIPRHHRLSFHIMVPIPPLQTPEARRRRPLSLVSCWDSRIQ